MKKIYLILILLPVVFSCNCYGEYILPTFKPLDNTADIVFIENIRGEPGSRESEIIAIDATTSKIVQIYRFNCGVFNITPKYSSLGYYYFVLKADRPMLIMLDIKSGTCRSVYNDTYIWSIGLDDLNRKVYFTDDYDHTNSYCYDLESNSLTNFTSIGAISSDIIHFNDSVYCVSFIAQTKEYDPSTINTHCISNLTSQTKVELLYNLNPFKIYDNKYLVSLNNIKGGCVVHRINSVEPEIFTFIADELGMIDDIYENNEYIYLISGVNATNAVTVIKKDDKTIVAKSQNMPEVIGGGKTVYKNGYAWAGADQGSGDFYRIDTIDYDGDGVLEWKLFTN